MQSPRNNEYYKFMVYSSIRTICQWQLIGLWVTSLCIIEDAAIDDLSLFGKLIRMQAYCGSDLNLCCCVTVIAMIPAGCILQLQSEAFPCQLSAEGQFLTRIQ
jgi:hypothetical protein